LPVETGMQAPVYHQHRPGLRRQVRLRALLKKRSGLHDGRPVDGYINIHELWWDYEDEEWHHHDLTADTGAKPVFGNPFGYEFSGPWGGQQFIVYEGDDHQIHELRWDAHTGRWHPRNLNEASEVAVLAHGPPTAYMFNSQWQQRHVLYVGTDNLVHELYWEPGADWHHGALTNAATAQANGIPTGFAFGAEGRQFVHYRGTDGHIHQLSWDNAAWRHLDLTANFGGPAALDAPPTGYVFLGELHVQYLGTDGHIHEFWWNGQWQHQDLTTRTGAPLALTGPSAYVLQKTQHVVFIARNNHIIELLWEP
jgi:hypothetical protein